MVEEVVYGVVYEVVYEVVREVVRVFGFLVNLVDAML